MASAEEDVVRRWYEDVCNGRRLDVAAEMVADGHRLHDPQVTAADGPQGFADAVAAYQRGVDGHWGVEEVFSAGDRVVVRWTGTGTHVGEMAGVPPTGRPVRVDAISIHRVADGQIAETWEVWDTLGFLQQLGVVGVPQARQPSEAEERTTAPSG